MATPWSGPRTIRVYGDSDPDTTALAAAFSTTPAAWTARPRTAPGEVAVLWMEPGDPRPLDPSPGPQGEVVVVLSGGNAETRAQAAAELPWKSVGVVDPALSWGEWGDTPPAPGALGALAADEIGRHFDVARAPFAGPLPPGLDARLGPWSPALLTAPDPRTRAEGARAAPPGTDLHALAADAWVGVRLAVATVAPAERLALSADPDPLVRARAADGLDDVARLGELTHDPSSVVRVVATDRLARARLPGADAALRASLQSADAYQRWKAAWGLGYVPGSAAALTPLLQDEDIDVRREAARSLGRLRDRSAIPALLAALHDDNSFVRRWATTALGELARPEDLAVREALRGAAKEPTALVAQAAARALQGLGEQVAPPMFTPPGKPADDAAIDRLVASADATTRKDTSKFLAGRADAGRWLEVLAADVDSEVRKSAVEAMGWSPATARGALAHLGDPDPDVRVTALDALRRGGGATVEALAPLLSAPDAEIRLRAVEALATLGPSPELSALAADPDERVRAAVASVAPTPGDPSLVARIYLLFPDETPLAPWLHGVLAAEDDLVHLRFSWNDDADRPAAHRALRPPVVRTYGHPDRG